MVEKKKKSKKTNKPSEQKKGGKLRFLWGTTKFVYKSLAVTFAAAAALYFLPAEKALDYAHEEEWISGTTHLALDTNLNDFRSRVLEYAQETKERANVALGNIPEIDVPDTTSNDLPHIRHGRTDLRYDNGKDAAEWWWGVKYPAQGEYYYNNLCLSTANLSNYDTSELSQGQTELYLALHKLQMSPTGRELFNAAAQYDVHICYNNLALRILGNYQTGYHLINVDELSIGTLAHELRHHWQDVHNLFETNKNELSYSQALQLHLAYEADAAAITALVNEESKIAKERSGDFSQVSFEDIQNHITLPGVWGILRDGYRAKFSSEEWRDFYAGQYVENNLNKARRIERSVEGENSLNSFEFPMLGEVFGHTNYMTAELIELAKSVAEEEVSNRVPQVEIPPALTQ